MSLFSWLNNVSLKYKFAALCLMFGVVPALALFVMFKSMAPQFKEEDQKTILNRAVRIAEIIDRNLFERYGDVQAFGFNTSVQDPANWRKPEENNPLIQAMNAYTKAYGIYKLMVLVDTQGKVLAVNSRDPKGQTIRVTDIYGLDFSQVAWFKKAMSGEFTKSADLTGTVIEQPTVSTMVSQVYGDDGYVMTFAAPVRNAAGETVGVWANFADVSFLEEIAGGVFKALIKDGFTSADVMVLDASGAAIMDFDSAKMQGAEHRRDIKDLQATNLVRAGDTAALRAQKGETGVVEAHTDGASELMVTAFVRSSGVLGMPDLGWTYLIAVPTDEAYATFEGFSQTMIQAMIVIAGFTLFAGYIIGARTAAPIKNVADTMGRIAQGDTKMTLIPRGSDEIGQMIASLNALKDRVGEAYRLKRMVDDIPTGIMTADAKDNFRINYMNTASKQMLKGIEHLINRPVDQLMGQSIDIFHKDPQRIRNIVSDPSRLPHFAKIRIGSEMLDLRIFAVRDADGTFVGPSLNWQNITKQLKIADDFEQSVKGVVDAVASAATELQASSQSMSATAEETSRQSTTVAAASEEATANVQTVASAAEELSASVTEISRQVSKSVQIASTAVEEARKTDATVQGLSSAAQKIGDVVKLISDIAGQTNLLALNATIEAARAGEAGKGFAVVASEVKNLANQTARATDEITSQIGAIQSATNNAVDAIRSIATTISEMNQISTAISAAVEEQGATTKEIARNVAEAAAGSANVAETISGVSRAASETGMSAGQVLNASGELSVQAERLRREVDNFLGSVRSAV
jgi:methyl-accepting chemotaxis protein